MAKFPNMFGSHESMGRVEKKQVTEAFARCFECDTYLFLSFSEASMQQSTSPLKKRFAMIDMTQNYFIGIKL